MGLFLLYIIACFSLFAEALQVRDMHVNPHVHVVYAAFCMYKMNPWKTNLGIFNLNLI